MKYLASQLRFVNGTTLNSEQLTHVTQLIFDTGPYLESSKNNRLDLPEIEFQKQVSILPALSHLRAILDRQNNVAGFYIAMSKQETIELY
nr:hypothetical protein [Burkholderiales bacterium]